MFDRPHSRKVKIAEKTDAGKEINDGHGFAKNDKIVRVDIYNKGGKYYVIPIYVADTVKAELPNKAVKAHASEKDWRIMDIREKIESGKTALGIEFGSTRIKGVLTDLDGHVLAIGFHDWENSLVNGIWTYSLEEIEEGLRDCYAGMRKDAESKYGVELRTIGAIGISAMMHGYIALDKNDRS